MAGRNHSPSKIGLALAGGGPEGAIYEIGALRAWHAALAGPVGFLLRREIHRRLPWMGGRG